MKWKLQPQEQENQKYFFNGRCLVTSGVQRLLTEAEVIQIVHELQKLAIEKGGIDYLQVYKNEKGDKIWVMDQLDEGMKKEHPKKHDYFTLLLPSEY